MTSKIIPFYKSDEINDEDEMDDEGIYTLTNYFPDCILPQCKELGNHSHILPHQQIILDTDTKYLYCQGGVGSAKSLAFAVKCVYLSCTLPNNVGVVSRLHYDNLYSSSWKEIKQCLERLERKGIIPKPKYSKKVQGDYTQIELWNGSIIKAIQGKNWMRGLGENYGFFWVDDAMESQEEFFIGNSTSAGLLSRLRLPHIHFHKSTYSEERQHGSLHGMVSSNPPPYGHWLHKLFGEKPGIHKIGGGEDSTTWMQVATSDNPFVGADYAKSLISVQKQMGYDVSNVRRVIYGESIPAYSGIPVFPQFNHKLHIDELEFKPNLPLIRSWDFGFNHPAVVFSNIYKCSYNRIHYFTLSEISDAFNLTVYELYDRFVKPHTNALYKNATLIRDAGDRAGYRSSSSNRDNRSDMKILIVEYKLAFKWRYSNLEPSLQYMRSLLQPKEPCQCGLPFVKIDRKCKALIGALEGGYRFSKGRDGKVGDKPVEERFFADVACAWRYGAENFVRFGMEYGSEDEELKAVLKQPFSRWEILSTNVPQPRIETSSQKWLREQNRDVLENLEAEWREMVLKKS